jgi:multicomponent K+:H+ antiporter subunit C
MSMELLMATGIGALTTVGLYLMLMRRTFPVIVGLSFLSYAVNVFLFTMGRLAINQPPILEVTGPAHADPLPQALVLTAIVITFGMTALIVVLSLRAYLETGTDDVGLGGEPADDDADDRRDAGAR